MGSKSVSYSFAKRPTGHSYGEESLERVFKMKKTTGTNMGFRRSSLML